MVLISPIHDRIDNDVPLLFFKVQTVQHYFQQRSLGTINIDLSVLISNLDFKLTLPEKNRRNIHVNSPLLPFRPIPFGLVHLFRYELISYQFSDGRVQPCQGDIIGLCLFLKIAGNVHLRPHSKTEFSHNNRKECQDPEDQKQCNAFFVS